jgi:glycosyltransferase involved in cell wall biosynthesis
MIWLDVTKSAAARHRSGLTRVTTRLAEELGSAATPIDFRRLRVLPRSLATASEGRQRTGAALDASDTFLTAEVFAPAERPGFAEFLARRPCRLAAIYHDSIPLRLPHLTWPQAVARHPAYLSMLAQFDLVWAVSAASRDELLGFWQWQGRTLVPEVRVLPLGADLAKEARPGEAGVREVTDGEARAGGARPPGAPDVRASQAEPKTQSNAPGGRVLPNRVATAKPSLLCVGILEPRKNQSFLLAVAERLWAEGLAFELHFVGRVNPHFGKPVVAEMRGLQLTRSGLVYDGPVSDERLIELYRNAAACVFPTIAEGCGLPLLEALWWGTPCIASDLPSLRENARGGGGLLVPTGNAEAWAHALRRVLAEPDYGEALRTAARQRQPHLPTWAQTAALLVERVAPNAL